MDVQSSFFPQELIILLYEKWSCLWQVRRKFLSLTSIGFWLKPTNTSWNTNLGMSIKLYSCLQRTEFISRPIAVKGHREQPNTTHIIRTQTYSILYSYKGTFILREGIKYFQQHIIKESKYFQRLYSTTHNQKTANDPLFSFITIDRGNKQRFWQWMYNNILRRVTHLMARLGYIAKICILILLQFKRFLDTVILINIWLSET